MRARGIMTCLKHRAARLAAVLFFVAMTPADGADVTTHVLVIGNDAYDEFIPLERSVNDANAYAQLFAKAGFKVFRNTAFENLDTREFNNVLGDFFAEVRGGDRVVVTYSGHGAAGTVETGAGGMEKSATFLIPTDVSTASDGRDLRENSIKVREIVERARTKMIREFVLIVDACRDGADITSIRNMTLGPANVELPAEDDYMVLFSSGSGQVSYEQLDPSDQHENSVFARVLIDELSEGGSLITAALNTQRRVVDMTKKMFKGVQKPVPLFTMTTNFELLPSSSGPGDVADRDQEDDDRTPDWAIDAARCSREDGILRDALAARSVGISDNDLRAANRRCVALAARAALGIGQLGYTREPQSSLIVADARRGSPFHEGDRIILVVVSAENGGGGRAQRSRVTDERVLEEILGDRAFERGMVWTFLVGRGGDTTTVDARIQ